MRRRLHRSSPSTIDPFIGVFSPKLVQGFRNLLRTPEVAEISFNFGSVQIHARSFREISELFTDRLGGKGLHVSASTCSTTRPAAARRFTNASTQSATTGVAIRRSARRRVPPTWRKPGTAWRRPGTTSSSSISRKRK